MKFLMAASLLLLSQNAFAANAFQCESNSGVRYEVFSSFGEIHEYNAWGKYLGYIDGLRTEVNFLDTYPPKTVTNFINEEDELVASIVESGIGISMSFEGENDIFCIK